MDFEEQLGVKLSVLVAGLMGGIVSLTYATKISALRALLLIVSGASVAAYLQPAIQHWLELPLQMSNALGFVLGLISMKVVQFIMQYSEKKLNEYVEHNVSRNTSSGSDSK